MSKKDSKHLTKDEIKKLYYEMKEGNLKSRETLILAYTSYVYHLADKYRTNYNHLYDDLASSGFIGLIKAVDSYILNDKTHIMTYASTCITNEMLMFIRKDKKYREDDSLNRKIGFHADIELIDTIEDKTINVQEEVNRKFIAEDMQKKMDIALPVTQKKVLDMHYGLNGEKPLTQKQIGEKMHFSRSCISRFEKTAIKTLKKVYQSEQEKESD